MTEQHYWFIVNGKRRKITQDHVDAILAFRWYRIPKGAFMHGIHITWPDSKGLITPIAPRGER